MRRSTRSATPDLGLLAADREHRLARVDADDRDARRGDRNRDAAGADAELDDRPAPGRTCLLDVEGHVLDDAPAPRVVEARDRVVGRVHPDSPADTFAAVDAEALEREAIAAVEAAATLDELDDARVRYLGRKSELTQALRDVRDRESGMLLNGIRDRLEAPVAARATSRGRARGRLRAPST